MLDGHANGFRSLRRARPKTPGAVARGWLRPRLTTGPIDRCEVLLRLRDGDGTMIAPTAFLPAAERFGLMHQIDQWVVREATRFFAAEQHAGRSVHFAVNLSGSSLSDVGMLAFIEDAIRCTGVDPRALVFEVTETLLIVLKLAPADHWVAARDFYLTAGTLVAGTVFVRRCIGTPEALVDFSPLRARSFSAACVFNFALGLGLYGSVYLLPLFLGFVRYHTPLEIGIIMTVSGVTQLLAAPLATLADKRVPASAVAAFGFGLFATGAFANAFETPRSDFSDLIVPQVLRGAAILFCILPITNIALDAQPSAQLANASGLLNLMRNVGGAIGIGLVDTMVNVRPSAIASQLIAGLTQGNHRVADFVGLPVDLVAGQTIATMDPSDLAFVRPVIRVRPRPPRSMRAGSCSAR